jgi:hypothetical protein
LWYRWPAHICIGCIRPISWNRGRVIPLARIYLHCMDRVDFGNSRQCNTVGPHIATLDASRWFRKLAPV